MLSRPAPVDLEESSHSASKNATKIHADEVGMTTETKDLYRDDQRHPWEEWAPDDIGLNAKASAESAKFALIVRREKQNGDTEEPILALYSITIQSPLLKALLGPVFYGYQGINTNLKKLEFSQPFHEFFYRWTEFVKAKPDDDEANETKRLHYNLLAGIITAEIQPHIEQAEDLLQNSVISFDYLWALFEPGTEIYSRVDGQDRLYLLSGTQYQDLPDGSRIFRLTSRYIDTDGHGFGYTSTTLNIGAFVNVKPISELSVLPGHLKAGIKIIREQLEARGRKFEQLKGFNYKSYAGFYTLWKAPFGGPKKRFVQDSRVVVDCSSFLRYNPDAEVILEPLGAPASSRHLDVVASLPSLDDDGDDNVISAPPAVQMMQQIARHNRRRFAASRQTLSTHETLSGEHYALCSPWVRGFCLKVKEWVFLYVDHVQDIEWNNNAFEQLVLPHDYKQIVWAFVEGQISNSDDFDDLVKGKGKGFIMLLSGEPGTGKTLTAESVSEAMKKPLYSIGAGELGIQAEEVERNLQRVLEISTKWGAVLLIDECDVFMVKRSTSDLQRNQLVSVFLRLLEYYQGVMFLTTNRVDSFDPAFESRIHLTINYPKLDHESRLHVWRTFLTKTASASPSLCTISDIDLVELAKVDLNGRQIKNVVKTARLLAAGNKAPLSIHHIKTVFSVKKSGSAYLNKT